MRELAPSARAHIVVLTALFAFALPHSCWPSSPFPASVARNPASRAFPAAALQVTPPRTSHACSRMTCAARGPCSYFAPSWVQSSHPEARFVPQPPWRQPRCKSMVSSVNSHTDAARIGWHLREIDLRFAPGLPPGWISGAAERRQGGTARRAPGSAFREAQLRHC